MKNLFPTFRQPNNRQWSGHIAGEYHMAHLQEQGAANH